MASSYSRDVNVNNPEEPGDGDYEGIDWMRLKGYCQPTAYRDHRGWYWSYGYAIQKGLEAKQRFWLCKACHQKNSHKKHLYSAPGVDNIKNHLREEHSWDENGSILSNRKRKRSIYEQLELSANNPRDQQIINTLVKSFNPARFKKLLVRWIIYDNISFHKIESPRFHDLLNYTNSATATAECLPTHTTTRNMVIMEFEKHKGIITELLRGAMGQIHMSFDLWTSRNMIALIGIVVHFLDADNRLRTFLLALPQQLGSHRGVNLAETVKDVLVEYGLEDKLGYFVADNAENNDTCLSELAEEYGFNKDHRRLRCMGHVINLVARMLLFGMDPDGFEEEHQPPKELKKELELWRKLGPVGKLHNIVVWVMRSTQRQQEQAFNI